MQRLFWTCLGSLLQRGSSEELTAERILDPGLAVTSHEWGHSLRFAARSKLQSLIQLLSVHASCAVVLVLLGCSESKDIETTKPRRDRIVASFREPGQTRLANTYLITMPVTGRIGRIDLEPGDQVKKGQKLAVFDRVLLTKSVEEQRAIVDELKAGPRKERIAVAQASVDGFKSQLADLLAGARGEEKDAARAAVDRAQAEFVFYEKELARITGLVKNKTASETQLEAARRAYAVSKAALFESRAGLKLVSAGPRAERVEAARAALRGAEQQLALLKRGTRLEVSRQAAARLARAVHELSLAKIESPVTGLVLQRFEQGDRSLLAGHQLMLLGSLKDLEVEVEVLTRDALLLSPGGAVEFDSSADGLFKGVVKKVEPAGFTKVSSLGVEQQRVRVIVALQEPPPGLGVGYRLHARFITASKPEALVVPRFSVLQSAGGEYYVFKIVGNKMLRQDVKIGLKSDTELEILEGLSDTDRIAATPDATFEDGQGVTLMEGSP